MTHQQSRLWPGGESWSTAWETETKFVRHFCHYCSGHGAGLSHPEMLILCSVVRWWRKAHMVTPGSGGCPQWWRKSKKETCSVTLRRQSTAEPRQNLVLAWLEPTRSCEAPLLGRTWVILLKVNILAQNSAREIRCGRQGLPAAHFLLLLVDHTSWDVWGMESHQL